MDALCCCEHRADEHDRLGHCHLCRCDDFRPELEHVAFAVGVLVPAPRPPADNVVSIGSRPKPKTPRAGER